MGTVFVILLISFVHLVLKVMAMMAPDLDYVSLSKKYVRPLFVWASKAMRVSLFSRVCLFYETLYYTATEDL